MNNKRISILGSGWLGLPLAEQLIQSGCDIALSTRDHTKFPTIEAIGASPFLVDIDNATLPVDFLNSDILICNIPSKNIAGFRTLIQAMTSSTVRAVLLTSSSSVYPQYAGTATEEAGLEDQEHPLYQIEQAFLSETHFTTTVLRLSGLIGYQRHPGRFFRSGKTVAQANAPVNLIHRDDCIALIKAIIQQAAWGEVMNACADTHPSKREFYSHARRLLGLVPPQFDDSQEKQYKIVSNAKIKQRLGYTFIYPDVMQIPFD